MMNKGAIEPVMKDKIPILTDMLETGFLERTGL